VPGMQSRHLNPIRWIYDGVAKQEQLPGNLPNLRRWQMSDFKRLIIEALLDKEDLHILNPILNNLKSHFSESCTIAEPRQIDEPSGAISISFAIEGDMAFSDLEANSLELIKLINLGCRVAFVDHLEKRKCVRSIKDALLYSYLEIGPELPVLRPSPRHEEFDRMEGAPGSRWKGFTTLCLVALLVVVLYKALAPLEPAPPTSTAAIPSQPNSGLSRQNNAKNNTPRQSPIQPAPNQVPQLNIPRFGVPAGNPD
jgi:hypothetical protein